MEPRPEVALAAASSLVWPYLDERQRRLLLAAGARGLGRGGITAIARATGASRQTVHTGLAELDDPAASGRLPAGRIRRPGGGRKRLTERDPDLLGALDALVDPDTGGDPESPLRWTCKSTAQLAGALTAQGIRSATTASGGCSSSRATRCSAPVRPWRAPNTLTGTRSLATSTSRSGRTWPTGSRSSASTPRNRSWSATTPMAAPSGSQAASPSRCWCTTSPTAGLGKAVPYGVYDLGANTGWVRVGCDHDTASFAVASLRRWWETMGRALYPAADRLLVTADAGGSNGYRVRLWKTELARFAAQTGLAVTVCHFPPGTSKWNKIEHRLFSAISVNWRGRPLVSHEVVVALIAATTTQTGLAVHAELDQGSYPLGVKVSDQELAAVPLVRHDFHGEGNYTIAPPACGCANTTTVPAWW